MNNIIQKINEYMKEAVEAEASKGKVKVTQIKMNNKRCHKVSLFFLFFFFYIGNCWESVGKLKTLGIKGSRITRTLDFQNRVYIEDLETWTYDFVCKATNPSSRATGDNETLSHAFYTLEKLEKSAETFKRVNLTTVNPETFLETFRSLSGVTIYPHPGCNQFWIANSHCIRYNPDLQIIMNKYSNRSVSTLTNPNPKEPDLAFIGYTAHFSDIRNYNRIPGVSDSVKNLYREKYDYTLTILNACINQFMFPE